MASHMGGNTSPCKEGAKFEQFLQPAELQNMLRSLKIKNAEMGTLSLNFYYVIAMKPFVSRQSQISENNKQNISAQHESWVARQIVLYGYKQLLHLHYNGSG